LAAVYFLAGAPLVGRFIRDRRPGDDPIDGSELPPGTSAESLTAEPVEISFTLGEATRTPVFWGLLLCVAVPPLVHTAVVFHQVALFDWIGWGAALVPAAF